MGKNRFLGAWIDEVGDINDFGVLIEEPYDLIQKLFQNLFSLIFAILFLPTAIGVLVACLEPWPPIGCDLHRGMMGVYRGQKVRYDPMGSASGSGAATFSCSQNAVMYALWI